MIVNDGCMKWYESHQKPHLFNINIIKYSLDFQLSSGVFLLIGNNWKIKSIGNKMKISRGRTVNKNSKFLRRSIPPIGF